MQSMAFFAEISGVENQIYRSRSGISNPRSRYFTRILSAGVVRTSRVLQEGTISIHYIHLAENGGLNQEQDALPRIGNKTQEQS